MDKVYWVKFYEDGRFVSVLGQPQQDKTMAKMVMAEYLLQIHNLGFVIQEDGPDSFHYDRYGTVCSVRVEEGESCF